MENMRLRPFLLVLGLTLCVLWASLASAADATAPAVSASPSRPPGTPTSVQGWADRCLNFTTNGWAFKTPERFLAWLDVFSDPGIWLEFTRRGLDPQTFVRMGDSLLDPATVRNYLQWTDPDIVNKWLDALAQPQFITAVNATLFDPGRFMRWVMLPLDPAPWDILLTALNPDTWVKWLGAPLDPATQALFNKAADPATLDAWLRALQDPANYPDAAVLKPVATTGVAI
jgi:hypothetical protein